MTEPNTFIMMPIPASQFTAVCALLGGAAVFAAGAPGKSAPAAPVAQDTAKPSATAPTPTPESPAPDGIGETATNTASPSDDDGAVDAHGHRWSADLHASTKGTTKDGLWRMKVGVSRPDPLPGFPAESAATNGDTGTDHAGTASLPSTTATSPTATETAPAPNATSTVEEDDEFAAFRTAAAASDAGDAAAAASVPARVFTDADLGALCNQAAVKLGDPSPVKELIATYTPTGDVAHSRNIPADKRAEFVKAVEAKAGIEFAG